MAPGTQSLDGIVDVQVLVSPLAAARLTFNEMLILGQGTHIPIADRVRKYTSPAAMLADGFIDTDPEYLAALLYFGQSPAPKAVWIGRQDQTNGENDPETPAQAIQKCREKNFEWYACMITHPSDLATAADHYAIAAYIETAQPSSIYGISASADAIKNGTADNMFEHLKGLGYKRTIGQFSTTEHAIAAIMGYAMGQNSGLAGSAFTLKFKQEVGVAAESLTSTEIATIEGNNGNVYLSYANYYNIFEQGKMFNGQFFDEILNLDMLRNAIQLNIMDLLYGNPKVPQTDGGVNQLVHAVNEACEQSRLIGFLGPGQWNGSPVLNLNTGDYLPQGYLTQTLPLSQQSKADREARKSPPLYVAVKEAGAVHSVLIGVYVDR